MNLKIVFIGLFGLTTVLFAGKGSVKVSSNIKDAYIYIKDIKKAMIGVGYTELLLEEGEHIIVIKKNINEYYEYKASKKIYIGEDTTASIKLKLKKVMTSFAIEQAKVIKIQKSKKIQIKKETTVVLKSGESIKYKGLIYGLIKSPYTNKIWLDRNLGASRVCRYSEDVKCYGDYFQWGRDADGHEKKKSITTSELSDNTQVVHSKFIISDKINRGDWLIKKNNKLWNKKHMINNPCPENFRVPSINELKAETLSVDVKNSIDAYNIFLKLPVAGYRRSFAYSVGYEGTFGDIWSSDVYKNSAKYLALSINNASISNASRAFGFSLRCIQNK